MDKLNLQHDRQKKSGVFNGDPLGENDLKIYEESDHFVYLLYHKVCRAMVGKANILNRFAEWEVICHHCKRNMSVDQLKFVKIEKQKPETIVNN